MNTRSIVRHAVSKCLGAPEGNRNAAKDYQGKDSLVNSFNQKRIDKLKEQQKKVRRDIKISNAVPDNADITAHHQQKYDELEKQIKHIQEGKE